MLFVHAGHPASFSRVLCEWAGSKKIVAHSQSGAAAIAACEAFDAKIFRSPCATPQRGLRRARRFGRLIEPCLHVATGAL
jgi:hypothetical protein